jgi:hypothetical protein
VSSTWYSPAKDVLSGEIAKETWRPWPVVWSKPPSNPRFTPRCAIRLVLLRCGGTANTQTYLQVFDNHFLSCFDLLTANRRIKRRHYSCPQTSTDFLARRCTRALNEPLATTMPRLRLAAERKCVDGLSSTRLGWRPRCPRGPTRQRTNRWMRRSAAYVSLAAIPPGSSHRAP